jgi:exodeoxyribonuclease III
MGRRLLEMKAVTWNVNGVFSHQDQVLRWVSKVQPDVVALQETQCDAARFPHAPFAEAGYRVVCAGSGGRNGVALLSRAPFTEVVIGVPGAVAPFTDARLIRATSNGVRVISAYMPNGRKVNTVEHQLKLGWLSLLAAVVQSELAMHTDVLLLADLNIAPTDDDVWDAHHYRNRNLTSPIERQAFADLIDVGLTDVVRAHHGPGKLSSWWNRRGDFFAENRGWRLDHVLASASMTSRLTKGGIDRSSRETHGNTDSDHAPVWAEFRDTDLL